MPQKVSDLHAHLGGSVPTHVMYEISYMLGMKLPHKSYADFKAAFNTTDQEKYFNAYHLTEEIQSSAFAIERCVFEMVAEAARSGVGYLEVRFNPLLRTAGGKHDMDRIITAADRGFKTAGEIYGVDGGLILCLGRNMPKRLNEIVVRKAVEHAGAVVGVDVAGVETAGNFDPADYVKMFSDAKSHGLGITVHCGETEYGGVVDHMTSVVNNLSPDRIGHGLACYQSAALMKLLSKVDVLLEICPRSNIINTPYLDRLPGIYSTILNNGIKTSICTDASTLLNTTAEAERLFVKSLGLSEMISDDTPYRFRRTK
jgi:adenosine deaminase